MSRLAGLLAALVAVFPAAAVAAPAPSRPPVILVVFDEFPTDSLVGANGRIDAVRYPGFAQLAGTSTWFRNHHAVADTTFTSIPSILTSTRPARHQRFKRSYKDFRHSLFTLLGRRGYRITQIDGDTHICPPRYCKNDGPLGLRPLTPVRERVDEMDSFLRGLRRERRPRFAYLHSLLPHVPWHLTPSGHLRDPGPPNTAARILGGPFGFDDPFLTLQDEQRHLLQVGYLDRVMGRLVRRLKRLGTFDRSLIVITADHGISFELGVANRRAVRRDGTNVEEIAPVPLFVKAPRQRRGRVSPAWVRGTDVVPTVADLLDVRLPWRAVGKSAYSRAARARRHLITSSPDVGYTVKVRGSVVEARRRANLARRHRLFGTGAWENVFRIGPNPELLGLSPDRLPQVPANGLRADFDLPTDLRNVNLSKQFLPSWAVGALRGRDAGPATRRDVALAVNGTIRAVGRTTHLDGVKAFSDEYFSLIVDERHLRAGRNSMQLYEVTRSGSNLALAPLGGR